MSDRASLLKAMENIIRDVFDDDSISISEGTMASDVKGWDSFNHINIVIATEKVFRVRFLAHEIENIKNVGAFVDLIVAKLGD